MDEMISRQAVLKLLSAMPPEEATTKAILIQSVQQMNAAQPEVAKDTNVLTNDCISRQAAIDALCNDYCGGHQDCKYYPKCENLKSIQKLPSAQTEIIRCRDCKLRDTEYCNMAHGFMGMKDDDYCSYAERRWR